MSAVTQVLPGVSKIYHINCDLLPERVDLRAICRMNVEINLFLGEIPIADGAECSCRHERNGASTQDTATLRFLTGTELRLAERPGFVVVDSEGCAWLIGCREAPRPKVSRETLRNSPASDRSGWSYEVTHTALRSMIPCKIPM
ncbi:MAG: hypothetical protein NC301_07475 [Bacteroides sp.]|nr:hypothetical protein [Bacteroides sp.]MCM1379993.1 hypothetical protein [Bacteroides sp.]MCM1446327.1 hypothetical protein [Prevotella sp.]